ncbi:MAG TPA: rhodanese-like domain-containing protein [Vicinamibacteria bacterium]
MPVKRVSPQEALELMEKEGYVYVDVRSIPEFEAGHPTGAFNVPLAHLGPHGMSPNTEFLTIMERKFAKDTKIVVGCKSGGRSLQAAAVLLSSGFTTVIDQRSGFAGAAEPGWGPQGLPTSAEAPAEHTYAGLGGKTK